MKLKILVSCQSRVRRTALSHTKAATQLRVVIQCLHARLEMEPGPATQVW
jgi:hypothetical protein